MNNNDAIKLPFFETIQRSFAYVFTKMDIYLKVTALWFLILVYEVSAGFPAICNLSPDGCSGSLKQSISVILLSLSTIGVIIAYSRVIILKTPTNYLSLAFGKREIKYLLFSIFLIIVIAVPSLALVFGLSYLGQLVKLPEVYFDFMILIPIIVTIYCSRMYLVFPAIAVDNKEMSMLTSFKLTVGNANRIFWGQVIMMVPVAFFLVMISMLFKFLGAENWLLKLVFVALVLSLSFLDACLKASYYSHVYQYFIFYQNRNKAE